MRKDIIKFKHDRDEIISDHKREVVKLYRRGYNLGELCRMSCLDISLILQILRKNRIKKPTLYKVYQNQADRAEAKHGGLVLERDKYYIDKFFPNSDVVNFSSSYYWFWKKNNEKIENRKRLCQHGIRHIRCSLCNKVLKDASNIPLEEKADVTTSNENRKLENNL